MVVVKTHRPTT